MINLDDLTIGQARQLAAQFSAAAGAAAQSGRTGHGWNIVVLDRGFVYVGAVSTDDRWLYIEDAANIRRWGTTRGLGELVTGPKPETKLDPAGNVKAPLSALVHLIEVEARQWETKTS
jgi:hypothetical protein